jgi:NtrC-family two-component system response regulator AlgB
LVNRRSRQPDVGDYPASLRDVERAYVQQVLAKSATLREAAKRLGIDMATLWRKRKRWGLA